MQDKRILEEALCLGTGVIESVWKEGDGTMVASCRPRKDQDNICPHCGRHRPVYDCSPSPRRWRTMDQGPVMAFIEYAAARVECPEHEVVVAAVPWAEHASRFTREFEQQVAWLACKSSKTATAELMRIDWASVGGICKRVYDGPDAEAGDRFDGRWRALDSGARRGLLPQRREGHGPLPRRELDDRRRRRAAQAGPEEGQGRREARRAGGRRGQGGQGQQVRAAQEPRGPHRGPGRVAREGGQGGQTLYRAYLKERLRDVFKASSGTEARLRLESWLASAYRTRIDEVKELSKKVRRHKEAIVRAVELGISNARFEAINNKIKLTVRMAYGFRNFDNLVALVMLRCSNLPIALPGR